VHSTTKAVLEKFTTDSPGISFANMEDPKTYPVLQHMTALDHPLLALSSYQNMKVNYTLWLLLYTCSTQRCHCNAQLKPDTLCIKGLPYEAPTPNHIDPNFTIQFIKFKYGNDRFSQEAITFETE
jgi:hypothetical protein